MSIDPDEELLNSLRSRGGDSEYGNLGQLARDGRRDVDMPLISPPDDLWDRISAAIQPPVQARRNDPRWWLGLAATIGLVVGVSATLFATRDTPTESAVVVQRAALKPLQSQGAGAASLVRRDGVTELDVRVSGLPSVAQGFYEVWLIDTKVERLVSLGPLRADGHYSVPAGVDASQYPIVDISRESLDGDPTHSSDSLLRGTLS